jgi:DNA-binding CsgD family transcriptional regulator
VKSYEEMLTPAALKLMQEKLRTMEIGEFTKDPRISRIFSRYRKETGGILLDLMERKIRMGLPNWNPTSERRFQAELEKLLRRIDAHLTMPEKSEAHSQLPSLTPELADSLRSIGMDQISPIVRLNTCYNASGALSLYEFAYRTNRMKVRGWGVKSERQFIEALIGYVSIGSPAKLKTEEPPALLGLEQDMSAFMALSDESLNFFYLRHFDVIQKTVRDLGREELPVSQITAELGVTWPFKHRHKQLKDFLFKEKSSLFHTPRVGKKKYRQIILSLIWAAKGSKRNMDRFSEMSPDELMDASPLSANEKQALTLRFLGEEPRTLEEAGRIMNVTRERVRQHQKTAETKLRTLGINQFARDWLRRHSSQVWAMLSDDDGATVEPGRLKGGIRKCVPGEVLLATVLAGWSLDDVLSLEGDPIDDWWVKKAKA